MKRELYANRPLSAGFPDLETRGIDVHASRQESHPYTLAVLDCLDRLVHLEGEDRRALVIGCGPKPNAVRDLLNRGYETCAVEPMAGSVALAREFLQAPERVRVGTAEAIPFESSSFGFVLMESVLEHVDSPPRALAEVFRVLKPGGVLYVYTTNRTKLHPGLRTSEYSVRGFNWFPKLVQECYVFDMLHYSPELANYNPRPAVHWFTFATLCGLGREAGFGQFYSPLDVIDERSAFVARSRIRRWALERVRYRPWLRALALTQSGGAIFMLKRPETAAPGP